MGNKPEAVCLSDGHLWDYVEPLGAWWCRRCQQTTQTPERGIRSRKAKAKEGANE